MNDNDLLDKIKNGFGLQTEAQLSAWLNISTSTLSRVRRGTAKLNLLQKLTVLDKIGFLKGRSLVESVSPEFIATNLKRISIASANKAANAKLNKNEFHIEDGVTTDSQILRIILNYINAENINFLVKFTDLPVSTLESIIANGAGILYPEQRLKIICRLHNLSKIDWPFEISKIEIYYNSSEELLKFMLSLLVEKPNKDKSQSDLIDNFKNIFDIETDSDLARYLGITRQQISHARSGITPLSTEARLIMASKIDQKIKEPNPINLEKLHQAITEPTPHLQKI